MYYYKYGTLNQTRGINSLVLTEEFVDTIERCLVKKLTIPVLTEAPLDKRAFRIPLTDIVGYIKEVEVRGNDIYLGIEAVNGQECVIEQLVSPNNTVVKLRTAYMAKISRVDYITYVKPDLTEHFPMLFFTDVSEFRKPTEAPSFIVSQDVKLGDVKPAYKYLQDKFGINDLCGNLPFSMEPEGSVVLFEDNHWELDKLHQAYIYSSLGIEHGITFKNEDMQKFVNGLDKQNCKQILSVTGSGYPLNKRIRVLTTKEFKPNE